MATTNSSTSSTPSTPPTQPFSDWLTQRAAAASPSTIPWDLMTRAARTAALMEQLPSWSMMSDELGYGNDEVVHLDEETAMPYRVLKLAKGLAQEIEELEELCCQQVGAVARYRDAYHALPTAGKEPTPAHDAAVKALQASFSSTIHFNLLNSLTEDWGDQALDKIVEGESHEFLDALFLSASYVAEFTSYDYYERPEARRREQARRPRGGPPASFNVWDHLVYVYAETGYNVRLVLDCIQEEGYVEAQCVGVPWTRVYPMKAYSYVKEHLVIDCY